MQLLGEEVDLRGSADDEGGASDPVGGPAGLAGLLQQQGVEIRSVRTSFSRINSAVGKGLFSVYSDVREDLDRGGSDVRTTSCMPHGAQRANQVPVETFPRRNLDRSLRIQGSRIL